MKKYHISPILYFSFSCLLMTWSGFLLSKNNNKKGELTVVTYNVAGLPSIITGFDSKRYAVIGQKLSQYDVVLVQEDFWYYDALSKAVTHPYRSPPQGKPWYKIFGFSFVNDGLNRFSHFPFSRLHRQTWGKQLCHDYFSSGSAGNDCLATKGFSRATHQLSTSTFIDIYNLHLESAKTTKGHEIRGKQLTLLFNDIAQRPKHHAIIVGGDFNFNGAGLSAELYARFEKEIKLLDAYAVVHGQMEEDSIDRIFFRSSPLVKLVPVEATDEGKHFFHNNLSLSDHTPKRILFKWSSIMSHFLAK